MIVIRTDTFLYWTGGEWNPDQDAAELFPDMDAAKQALTKLPPPPTGETVNLVAVAGAN